MTETSAAYERTVRQQRLVGSPAASAWVAANAGAGKTKVLTDRVMRLLLAGSLPSRILCITFTKAAAAEMAERLFKRLGEWALMDDESLAKELIELDEQTPRSPDELSTARRLFARALETPGGLKIQTIHSFCESVLKRFPLEANVSPGFSVLEEREADAVLHDIISMLAVSRNATGGEFETDFARLTGKFDEQTLRKDVFDLSRKGRVLRETVRKVGGDGRYWQQMAASLGVVPGETPEIWWDQFSGQVDRAFLEGAYSALLEGTKTDKARAQAVRSFLDATTSASGVAAAKVLFLTAKNEPLKKLAGTGVQKKMPEIESRLREYQEKFLTFLDKSQGFEIYETTRAIHRLALAADGKYTDYKSENGLLDFDDLIFKTVDLFEANSADWVLYKLDQGIDHVLLDEAQDTSDGQWQVVMQPLQEFFAGSGAREADRTAFVVGDEKQSIYSFQGADVGLFRTQQSELAKLIIPAGQAFHVEDLTLSFRSTAPVLHFVDEVFSDPEAAKGVSEHTDLQHVPHRDQSAGLVELWPLVVRPESPRGNPWDAPVDMPDATDPARQLAEHMADTISNWISQGAVLESEGRAIRPGDIMILCQRRGPVFHEVVRALTKLKIPTAGADRIKLKEHVAVKDLLSAARFSLQTADDLSLAEVLKSPLFGFDDDALFEIAHGRTKGTSLWQALAAAADAAGDTENPYTFAVESLRRARKISQKDGPFAFFSYLLDSGNPSGWKRFYRRLGLAARDVLNEFLTEVLAYEAEKPRTLQGFCAYLDRLDADLKRELDGTDDLVRVMTVHGSKGLEANIVFLADAAYANFTKVGAFLPMDPRGSGSTDTKSFDPHEGFPVRVTSRQEDPTRVRRARATAEAVRAEEYRRLFYVAATRARDRLYICGQTKGRSDPKSILEKPANEASWYALAANAFDRMRGRGLVECAGEAPWGGEIWRLKSEQCTETKTEDRQETTTISPLPGWLKTPAIPEKATPRVQASKLGESEDAAFKPSDVAFRPAAEIDSGISAYTRGTALHLLLEKLPEMDREHREDTAFALLQKNFPEVPAEVQQTWVAEVMTILTDPKFQVVFAENSRAEVPVIGSVPGAGGDRIVSGQIDRLVVSEDRIVIIDYKTNRPPPATVTGVPSEYIAQLAAYRTLLREIYPGRRTECALLWTWEARLMEIPDDVLDHALVH